MRISGRRTHLALAVAAVVLAGAAAHALVAISSASFRINNASVAPGGAISTSANFKAAQQQVGHPIARLRTSAVSAVEDWQQLQD